MWHRITKDTMGKRKTISNDAKVCEGPFKAPSKPGKHFPNKFYLAEIKVEINQILIHGLA